MTRTRAHLLAVSVSVAGLAAAPASGGAASRDADPVVVTGAQAPALAGADPGRVVAFRRGGSGWEQVPVQVDERAVVNLGQIYGPAGGSRTSALVYTDPQTFTGADPDPTVDANDELALMWRDTGARAPSGAAPPPGVRAGSAVELALQDPLDAEKRWAYLYEATDPSLDQGAGKRYVDYRFALRSGDYRTTYKLGSGPNPEDSTVRTASYSARFPDRWVQDELRVTAGGATGADLLDRQTEQYAPTECGISEASFSGGEGAFIANKTGPVRAIRSYFGANSGPYVQRDNVFYDAREEVRTYLRVHSIGGAMDLLDYSPAAVGMTYRNSLNPQGVTVDGMPDQIATGLPGWEQVTGAQGTLTSVFRIDRLPAGVTVTGYYADQRAPDAGVLRLCTGDADALALSGPCFNSSIPNTDPSIGAAQPFETTRVIYADPPGGGAQLAQARAAGARDPVRVDGASAGTLPSTSVGSGRCVSSAPPLPSAPARPVRSGVRFDRKGRLRIQLECPASVAPAKCRGRIKATALLRVRKRGGKIRKRRVYLGKASYIIGGNARGGAIIRPSRSDRRAMGSRSRVRVELLTSAAGSTDPPKKLKLTVRRP